QVTENAPKEDRNYVTSRIPQTETAPGDEAVAEKSTGGGAAQKKKKKKQKPPVSKNKTGEIETSRKAKAQANSCQNTDTSHQDEKISQQSDEQLWKEVDWCVNQLELGLKTQKPTPKQAEEALRAIKTLRSDKAPLVKKRQLMRAMFGDYRKKMQEELSRELKLMETAAKSASIVELKGSKKNGQFIRKCLGACRKSQGSAESPSESHGTLNTGLFNFTTPQEFHFNFF
ncbi:CH033 protein, partial [Horornis vulcanius]|nr:CH033 protein [Horornis vulcanius]